MTSEQEWLLLLVFFIIAVGVVMAGVLLTLPS
jgi:hypothetical protein